MTFSRTYETYHRRVTLSTFISQGTLTISDAEVNIGLKGGLDENDQDHDRKASGRRAAQPVLGRLPVERIDHHSGREGVHGGVREAKREEAGEAVKDRRLARHTDPAAVEINALHADFLGAAQRTVEIGMEIGKQLAAKKDELGHGAWLPWIVANPKFSDRTASN
jgi:hypothetical protein